MRAQQPQKKNSSKKRRKTQVARGASCGHVLSLSFVRLYRGPYRTRLRRRRSCRRRRFGGTWGWGAQVRAWSTDVAVVEDVMLRRSVLASDCDAKRRRDAVRWSCASRWGPGPEGPDTAVPTPWPGSWQTGNRDPPPRYYYFIWYEVGRFPPSSARRLFY